MADPEGDWRLTNQQTCLGDATLERREYVPRTGNDHDHCAFCFAEFGGAHLEVQPLTHGYTTTSEHPHGAGYHGICEDCFRDFRRVFGWRLVSAG